MELDFTSLDRKYNKYKSRYEYFLEKAFNILGLNFDPIISVSLINNEEIHKINKEYRNIDRPTDVISFAFLDNEDKDSIIRSKIPVSLGDIYISVEKAEEQAKEFGHSIDRELCFLFVHGLLHLLGYDHMDLENEKVMFSLQDKILEGSF